MTVETLTPATSSPWTCPAGVTSIQVEGEAPGGGGGGGHGVGGAGGAGGGGGYFKLNAFATTPGNTYAFQIGSGGARGGTDTDGSPGTADTFWVNTATGLAKVGLGGINGNGTRLGGAGGASASGVGDVKKSGGTGGNGHATTGGGGGGGGSGGDATDGGVGGNGPAADGGTAGAAGTTNGAAGGKGGFASLNAIAGVIPGGGGGGGYRIDASGTSAAGANGRIVLTYTAVSSLPPSRVVRQAVKRAAYW